MPNSQENACDKKRFPNKVADLGLHKAVAFL